MTGEQTILSKILSTVVEKTSLRDVELFVVLGLAMASLTAGSVPTLLPVALLLLYFGALKAMDHGKRADLSKNGVHKEVVESDERSTCEECETHELTINPTIGYSVYYLLGYEIVRLEDFRNSICSRCESAIDAELEEETGGPESTKPEPIETIPAEEVPEFEGQEVFKV